MYDVWHPTLAVSHVQEVVFLLRPELQLGAHQSVVPGTGGRSAAVRPSEHALALQRLPREQEQFKELHTLDAGPRGAAGSPETRVGGE